MATGELQDAPSGAMTPAEFLGKDVPQADPTPVSPDEFIKAGEAATKNPYEVYIPPTAPNRFTDRYVWALSSMPQGDMVADSPQVLYAKARALMKGIKQDAVETADQIVPFSVVKPLLYDPDYSDRARRVMQDITTHENKVAAERRATWHDYLYVAGRDEAAKQSQTGFWNQVGGGLRSATKFGMEIGLTGGFSADLPVIGRVSTGRGLGAATSEAVRARSAILGEQVATALGEAAGTVARAVPMSNTVNRLSNEILSGQDYGTAVARALMDTAIQIGTEMLGKWFEKPLKEVKLWAAQREWAKRAWIGSGPNRTAEAFGAALKKAGYNGIMGEIFEERVGEVWQKFAGLDPQGGVIEAVLDGRLQEAWDQLATEFATFAIPGAAHKMLEFRGYRLPQIRPDSIAGRMQQQAEQDLAEKRQADAGQQPADPNANPQPEPATQPEPTNPTGPETQPNREPPKSGGVTQDDIDSVVEHALNNGGVLDIDKVTNDLNLHPASIDTIVYLLNRAGHLTESSDLSTKGTSYKLNITREQWEKAKSLRPAAQPPAPEPKPEPPAKPDVPLKMADVDVPRVVQQYGKEARALVEKYIRTGVAPTLDEVTPITRLIKANRKERLSFVQALEKEFPGIRGKVYDQMSLDAYNAMQKYAKEHNYDGVIEDPKAKGYRTKANQDKLNLRATDTKFQELKAEYDKWRKISERHSSTETATEERKLAKEQLKAHDFSGKAMQYASPSDLPGFLDRMIRDWAFSNELGTDPAKADIGVLHVVDGVDSGAAGRVRQRIFNYLAGKTDPRPAADRLLGGPATETPWVNQLAVWYASKPDVRLQMLEAANADVTAGRSNEFVNAVQQAMIFETQDPNLDPWSAMAAFEVYARRAGVQWKFDDGSGEGGDGTTQVPFSFMGPDDQLAKEYRHQRVEAVQDKARVAMETPTVMKYPEQIPVDLTGTDPTRGLQMESTVSGGKNINWHQIDDFLEKLLNLLTPVPIHIMGAHIRRLKQAPGANGYTAGIFDPARAVIQMRQENNLPTKIHEFGHALDFAWIWDRELRYRHGFDRRRVQPVGTRGYRGALQNEVPFWLRMDAQLVVELNRFAPMLTHYRAQGASVLAREAFAEWMRIWMTHPNIAQERAPNFTREFERYVTERDPNIMRQLHKARAMVQRYSQQGAEGRAMANMVHPGSWAEAFRDWKDRFHWLNLAYQWIDRRYGLKWFYDKAFAITGEAVAPAKNAYEFLRAVASSADDRVTKMMEEGGQDFWGNYRQEVRPLKDAAALVGDKLQDKFRVYLWARHAIRLSEPAYKETVDKAGNRRVQAINPRNAGLPLEDARFLVDKYEREHPQFLEAADIVYKWNLSGLELLAQSSRVGRRIAKAVYENSMLWGSYEYIPLARDFRAFDRLAAEGYAKGVGNPFTGDGLIKGLYGSGHRVIDPFAQMIKNMVGMVETAQNMYAVEQLMNFRDDPGMAWAIMKVDPETTKLFSTTVRDALEKIKSKLGIFNEQGVNVTNPLAEMGLDIDVAEDAEVAWWSLTGKPDLERSLIPWVNPQGQLEVYWVNPHIFRAIRENPNNVLHTKGGVGLALRAINKVKVAKVLGVTSLRPAFDLWTNPLRDVVSFMLNTQIGTDKRGIERYLSSGTALLSWFSAQREAFNHFVMGKESEWIKQAERMGLLKSNIAMENIERSAKHGRKMFRASRNIREKLVDWRSYPGALNDIFWGMVESMQFAEHGSRLAEFKAVAGMAHVNWQPGDQMQGNQHVILANAWKRVTTDHTGGGNATILLNLFIPFWRSTFMAPLASYEAIRRDPYLYLARGATLAGLTALYWLRVKDEEWYDELGDYRNQVFLFHLGGGDDAKRTGGVVLKVPRPYDMGYIFSSAVEACLHSIYKRDPQFAQAMAVDLLETHVPMFSKSAWYSDERLYNLAMGPLHEIPIFNTALELAYNRSDFTGRTIVPPSKLNLAPADQYTQYTPELLVRLGRAMGWSPARMEYFIEGMAGTATTDAIDFLSTFMASTKDHALVDRNREVSEWLPGIGPALFRRGGVWGTQTKSIEDLYKTLHDLTANHLHETSEDRVKRLILTDATDVVKLTLSLREYAPTVEAERELMYEATKWARETLTRVRNGEFDRLPLKQARARLRRDLNKVEKQAGK